MLMENLLLCSSHLHLGVSQPLPQQLPKTLSGTITGSPSAVSGRLDDVLIQRIHKKLSCRRSSRLSIVDGNRVTLHLSMHLRRQNQLQAPFKPTSPSNTNIAMSTSSASLRHPTLQFADD
jgi:hypothetical protein